MAEPPAWHVQAWTGLLAALDSANDALVEPNTTALRVGMTSVIRRLSFVPFESYAPIQPLHPRLRSSLMCDFLRSDLPAARDAMSFGYAVYGAALHQLQVAGAQVDTLLEWDAFSSAFADFMTYTVRPKLDTICDEIPQQPIMWVRFLDTIEEEDEDDIEQDE
ncbi:uncharacterized protein LOC62_02G003361 [Vanrija pseudolonga]|uniref:Uncharacterized protein n=1 Tax=Vanrija pseudolonga TaxID=143232 RepID=A0AAF0Y8T6_9TREE|nr:hypothetical protein LOC62_02G003361 [Vanrija pseudolonga]